VTRTIVALAALLLGLTMFDRVWVTQNSDTWLGKLLTDAERERVGENVAAVKLLQPGAPEPLVFARVRGEWRCLSLASAPASTRAIQAVVDALFAARGLTLVRITADESAERDATYGLATGDRFEVSFHGTQVLSAPDADTLLAVQIGREEAGRDRSFARVTGRSTIFALDRDLRSLLASDPRTGLPALLDPHVVPASWSTRARGPRRIRVERLGAPAYELELDDERWFLVEGDGIESGRRRECHRLLARGYTLFLARTPFVAVLPKDAARTSGLDSPRGIVRITPVEGDELLLTLGDATAPGVIAIENSETGNVFAIDAGIAALLLPEPDALLDPSRGNPWDPYLR